MRNLNLSTCFSVSDDQLKNVNRFCVDCDTQDVYFITGSCLYHLKSRNEKAELCCDFHQEHPELGLNDDEIKISGLSYLPELQSVCLVVESGEIICYDVNTNHVEVIGSVESGILVAEWSLDGDILAIVTGHDSVILMTREFQPLRESQLFTDDFGEGKPVTVGWGKKETQFRGSEGKVTSTKNENITEQIFEWDDTKPRITWRGDGQFFAINALSPTTNFRQIYVYSRDGLLQFTSEMIKGLEAEVCWRPNGQVIAAVQRLPNKYQIIFVEKNGLVHGELVLPFTSQSVVVRGVDWSSDSSLMSIWIEDLPDKKNLNAELRSEVQIWTMNNYHWYLKQTLKLPKEKHFSNVVWHPEKNLTLLSLTKEGNFVGYSWNWMISRSEDESEFDDALVAVIDGCDVLLTPFRVLVVPPPFSASKLNLSNPVNQILFPKNHSRHHLAVLSSDFNIYIYSKGDKNGEISNLQEKNGTDFKNKVEGYSSTRSLKLDTSISSELPLIFHHWVWINAEIFISVKSTGETSKVVQFNIDEESKRLVKKCEKEIDGIVCSVISSCENGVAIIQLNCGKLFKYNLNENEFEEWSRFPRFCSKISTTIIEEKEFIFGLNDTFRLYCFDKELPVNCTSFDIHDEFLILTTTDHKLHCVPLTSKLLDVTNDFDIGNCRAIERGSRIVTSIRNGTRVILQMPRGNLEAIHPRALLLNVVYKCLENLNFIGAFELMRKHRLNMNLLFDYNPEKFLGNVNVFVSQINNINWINIFLTDLKEGNISQELYDTNEIKFDNKLNTVHSAVRKTLKEFDSNKFLLSILTTYVMMDPPQLENALNEVKSLNKKEKDDALNYLQYLIDINDLYDVALGTYDFDLVLMVAQKSQKDPKEYLPFLNSLRKMEINYQRYNIDCYLKKPEKALENIFKCGNKHFDKCLQHIKNHNLYLQAFKLFTPESDKYPEICVAYAEYLNGVNKFDEAGIWFRRGGNFQSALTSFEKCLRWKEAMCMAREENYSEKEMEDLATRLVDRLTNERQFKDAAFIQENYLKNIEGAIQSLIDGNQWQSALEMIYRCDKKEMIDSHLEKSVEEYWKVFYTNLTQIELNFGKYVNRLTVVREEKAKKVLNVGDDNDTMSEMGMSTTTGASESTWMSNTSRQTAKNRRKHEKKKFSLKEGSRFEEGALVEALLQIVVEVDKSKEDCGELLRILTWFGKIEKSELLQSKLHTILEKIKINLSKIWLNEIPAKSILGPESTSNSIAAAMQGNYNNNNNNNKISLQSVKVQPPPKLRTNVRWKIDLFPD